MKKLLILLALAACAACNTEDDNDNRQTATFGGTLTITSNQTPSATPFVTNNISFVSSFEALCRSSLILSRLYPAGIFVNPYRHVCLYMESLLLIKGCFRILRNFSLRNLFLNRLAIERDSCFSLD